MAKNGKEHASVECALLAILIAALFLLIFFITNKLNANESKSVDTPTISDFTLVIDAGHGGEDGGTSSAEGVLEKELNLKVAKEIYALCRSASIRAVMTRTDDRLLYDRSVDYKGRKKILDMKERLRITEACENPIFISIHMNAFPETKYKGLQVYYSENNEISRSLALALQSGIKESLQPDNNRVIKKGNDIYLLERLTCPAILIECGFLSNKEEASLLSSDEYRKKLAERIFYAIIAEIT